MEWNGATNISGRSKERNMDCENDQKSQPQKRTVHETLQDHFLPIFLHLLYMEYGVFRALKSLG